MTEDRLARLEALADQMAGTIAKFTGRSTAHYRNPMTERIAREGQDKPLKKIGPLAAALIPLAGAAIGAVGSAVGGLLSGPGFQPPTQTTPPLQEHANIEDSAKSGRAPDMKELAAMLMEIGRSLAEEDGDGLQAVIDHVREVCPFEADGEPIRKTTNTPLPGRSPLAEYARRQMQRPRGQMVSGTFVKDASPDAFLERLREVIRGAQTGEIENPWRELGFRGRTWPRRQDPGR